MGKSISVVAGLALWLAVGCGGGSGLSKDEVTNLPDGNATGTALSGEYRVRLTTTACSGQCPSFTIIGSWQYSICKVGDVDNETVTLTQQDGHLTVEGDTSIYVTRLEGGIDQDGSFDVGGYEMQGDGQVQVTARTGGTISGTGHLTGSARAKGTGSADGKTINCVGSYTLEGDRQ